MDRKLQDVLQDLALLQEQGKIEGFFKNVENASRLGGLVDEIRDAMMEYQVCVSNYSPLPCLMFVPDFIATRYLRQATRHLRKKSHTRRKSRPHSLAFVLAG